MNMPNQERALQSAMPPHWAEAVLVLSLNPADRESVSGDLLEEYRVAVLPAVGRWRADIWYVAQVFVFVWRLAWMWGALQSGAFVMRTALDWFAPPADFHLRSFVSTWTAIAVFAWAGLWTAWRYGSLRSGVLTGIAASVISAVLTVTGCGVLLALWHDPLTRAAIDHSGGLAEVFELPILVLAPAMVVATSGAVVGKLLHAGGGRSRNHGGIA